MCVHVSDAYLFSFNVSKYHILKNLKQTIKYIPSELGKKELKKKSTAIKLKGGGGGLGLYGTAIKNTFLRLPLQSAV